MRDESIMLQAIALAARAAGNTSPNPMVGAVVAAPDGTVVGSGYHERAGAPHAEALALERAGARANGATLYVTLEPCHLTGRTPPCTDAIIASGVVRIVVAMVDPDARERGRGVELLRAAGIDVTLGAGGDEARELNRMYVRHRESSRPYVTLKMAVSVDGAIGNRPGERRRLTGEEADHHVRALRFEHDAVMIGIGTAIVDDPQLTVRPHRERAVPYRRIVVDSMARLPLDSALVRDRSTSSTVVACVEAAPPERVRALEASGVDVVRCNGAGGRVDLADLLDRLGAMPLISVLCEGGPTLATALMQMGVVDELHWLVSRVIFGKRQIPAIRSLSTTAEFDVETSRRLGDDALIVARPRRSANLDERS